MRVAWKKGTVIICVLILLNGCVQQQTIEKKEVFITNEASDFALTLDELEMA
jgi:hypothetical protein